MTSSKKVILISSGDPSGISSEITIKAIQSSKINENVMPVVITDPRIINDYSKIFASKPLQNLRFFFS